MFGKRGGRGGRGGLDECEDQADLGGAGCHSPRILARKKQRRPRERAPCLTTVPLWLRELDDVLRRRTLLALDDFELDALAFGERLEALRLDCGVMHEAVLLAVLGRDETEPLRVVEPLHGTCDTCHLMKLLC